MPRKITPAPLTHYDRDGILALEGDMRDVLEGMDGESFTACVTDPPYGLEFMGKEWDKFGRERPYQKRVTSGADANTKGILPYYGRGGTSEQRAAFHAKANADFQAWATECFRAVLRVLKPGGVLIAFGGTRTYHRMACAVEDAGFEVRDCLMWLQGQGFPKSIDVSKEIDRVKGTKRRKGARRENGVGNTERSLHKQDGFATSREKEFHETEPSTPEAALWTGYGSALKPAWEPIILAMKPLDGGYARNALTHGVAGLNVDGGRIGTQGEQIAVPQSDPHKRGKRAGEYCISTRDTQKMHEAQKASIKRMNTSGRWPANVLLSHDPRCVRVGESKIKKPGGLTKWPDSSKRKWQGPQDNHSQKSHYDADGYEAIAVYACVPGCPVRMLDEQSGTSVSRVGKPRASTQPGHGYGMTHTGLEHANTGGASRFFYTAKASTAERRAGLSPAERNLHPTVKPVDLMRYLITLVTMPSGTRILDPFMGSGSTLVAAKQLGVECVGIDLEQESCETAAARLSRRTSKGVGKRRKVKCRGRSRRKSSRD